MVCPSGKAVVEGVKGCSVVGRVLKVCPSDEAVVDGVNVSSVGGRVLNVGG